MFSFLGYLTQPPNGSSSSQPKTSDEETNEDSDAPPMFPAANSIQRSHVGNTSPPNNPTLNIQSPDEDVDLYDENNPADDLPDINLDNLSLPLSTLKKPPKPRKKVHLMPGFSQLDWAKLKASGVNLRGEEVTSLRRITKSELAEHKTKEDAWSSFNGRVYNITPYLSYHPGGVRELMRVAGKDGIELFMKTHAWISIDSMLDSCLLGFLVND